MHRISKKTIQAAQKHALKSREQGESVEKFGESLKTDEIIEPKIGQSIEKSGKMIQEKSQESLNLAEELIENNSTEVFAESVQAHVDAVKIYIEATKKFIRRSKFHLPAID